MVCIVATQDPAQPGPLFRDRLMPVLPEGVLDLRQLGPHPLLIGIASELELPITAGTTDVREPKKRQRFGSPLTPSGSIAGRIAPKLDEAGLLRMEVQGKGGEAFMEGDEKLLGVVPVLEAHDGVIGVAGDDPGYLGVAAAPLMCLEVQYVMQIDIGKQWGDHCSLHHPLLRFDDHVIFYDTGLEPFTDETQ